MKPTLAIQSAVWSALFAACAVARAADSGQSLLLQNPPETDWPLNRIGLSYRPAINIRGRFQNVGGALGFNDPGPAASHANHNYDDGYNRVDGSAGGNAGGVTSYWGYQFASQVPGNNTIVMTATSPTLGASSPNLNGDPQHGFELTYNRELGSHKDWHWGIEGAFGFTDVTIHYNENQAGGFTRTSDTFSLDGITPPPVPPAYNGPFNPSPGAPVIGDSPTRSVAPVNAVGFCDLDAKVCSVRLGPYLELAAGKRWAFSLSGGFALMYVNSDFNFQESAVPAMPGQMLYTGSGSRGDVLPGGYVSGNVSYRFTRSMDISAGAQYVNVGAFSQTENGKRAQLDFSNSIFFTIGVGYRF
jgi:hypothetical protein